MGVVDRMAALLPAGAAKLMDSRRESLTQIRLRAGRPVQFSWASGRDALSEEALDPAALAHILAALMEFSVYARQDELDSGYFTLDDGSRVGVCGRLYRDGSRIRMAEIGSACVRVSRQVPGCAGSLMDTVAPEGRPRSTLLVSSPGLGKTTMLRDIARQLSERGLSVGIADERHELAACLRGVPTLDVGPRADVMDGCPKAEAIGRMLRAMAPDVVVADEIGSEADAAALADAARCGVAVVASAHADSLGDALSRGSVASVLENGAIGQIALLGPTPGAVKGLWRRDCEEGEWAWRRA